MQSFPPKFWAVHGRLLVLLKHENPPLSGLGVIWPLFGFASRTCHVALCGARISHNACLSLGHHVHSAHWSLACSALPALLLYMYAIASFSTGGL